MKLKKFALRGLIALAVVVAVCMFFSRTVQTITTPKVQVITAENGRFEEKLSYTAQVHFANTDMITCENPHGMQVAKTHVRPGDQVQAGDAIFTLELPGYATHKAVLQAEHNDLSIQLMELDATNYSLPREAPGSSLYDAMAAASVALNEAIYAARLEAARKGEAMPLEDTEEVRAARAAYDQACEAYHAYTAANPDAEAVLAYVSARQSLLADMEVLMAQMLTLDVAASQDNRITAPRAGYITSVDAANLTYTLTAEGCQPVLRCLAPGRTIAEGTRADISSELLGTERSKVTGMTGSFLHIAIPEDFEKALPELMETGVQVSITNRAKQATTLLPPSALRSDGENDYVYQIEYVYGGILSTKSMKVVKVPVTVIQRSSQAASIAEDLEDEEIAIREDRLLTDGQTVMQYVN